MNNNKQNWNNLGEQFKTVVQDALDSKDFRELNNLVTMSFNNILAEVIKHSYKDGYKNAVSSIDKARDKLLQLAKNEAEMRIPAEDIYIKGGKFCENDFYVFANRYRFY